MFLWGPGQLQHGVMSAVTEVRTGCGRGEKGAGYDRGGSWFGFF